MKTRKRLWPVLAAVSLFSTVAAGADLADESRRDRDFVEQEYAVMNCDYVMKIESSLFSILHIGGVPRLDAQNSFGLTSEMQRNCPALKAELMNSYRAVNPASPSRFPFYGATIKKRAEIAPLRQNLDAAGLATPTQATTDRPAVNQLKIDAFLLEKDLREELNTKGSPRACAQKFSPAQIHEEARSANIYDSLRWKSILHDEGYNCAVSLFYQASAAMNQDARYGQAQAIFEKSLQESAASTTEAAARSGNGDTDVSNPAFKAAMGSHKVILFFPPLGYDLPGRDPKTDLPRELLTMREWNAPGVNYHRPSLAARFQNMNVPLELIERTTVQDVSEQIASSQKLFLEKVRLHLSRDPSAKFIVVGRSMGGYIAREVLSRSVGEMVNGQKLPSVVEAAVLIGSTPFGSVIARYKARADVYDATYKTIPEVLHNLLPIWLGITNDPRKDIASASFKSANIGSMSHTRFDASAIAAARQNPYKVLNVMMVPATVEGYFSKAANSESVDPTFMLMSMYGPTEGSSPLTHASWDTQSSARVFVKDRNHLAFWDLTPKEGISVITGALMAAQKMGMIGAP